MKQPTTCNFQDLVQPPLIPHKCLRSWKNRVLPRQVKQGEGYVSVINQCHLQRRLRVCPHHTLPVPVMGNSFSHCHWELDLPRKTVSALTCPVASLPCKAEDTVLCHRKPTSSHHKVRQLQSHPPPDKGVFVFSPSFFPMLQQRKENSRRCRSWGVRGAGAAVL